MPHVPALSWDLTKNGVPAQMMIVTEVCAPLLMASVACARHRDVSAEMHRVTGSSVRQQNGEAQGHACREQCTMTAAYVQSYINTQITTSFNTCWLRVGQFMAGGDLGSALHRDEMENGPGTARRLGWYARGRVVLMCVARGLTYLHDQRVRLTWNKNHSRWKSTQVSRVSVLKNLLRCSLSM